MKEGNNVINILRNVKELKIKGELVRKYNPKEEFHEVFYVLDNDILDEQHYQNLSSEEQDAIETVNLMSSWKKSDNHPAVVITSEINWFLIDSLELDRTQIINDTVETLRMLDIIELARVFNYELGLNIDTDPATIIDITNIVGEIQAKMKGEFPEFLQATEILYKKEKIAALINLNQKNIEGDAAETNKFILRELKESNPTGVYVYADTREGQDIIILDVETDSELWSMKIARDVETGFTMEPHIEYAENLKENATVKKIKTLYFLASVASMQGEELMLLLPNILKYF